MKKLYMTMALSAALLVGCGSAENNNNNATTPIATQAPATTETPTTDATTTASIVNDNAAFEKAISTDGTWIIATLNDLTFSTDLVLEGDFQNNRGEVQRKIALYTQDADKNVTNRFTLTAPKLTVKSPNARIQNGTFVGDIYVETNDFQLVATTVTGNVYFATEEAKAGFTMDADSSVSGVQEVK